MCIAKYNLLKQKKLLCSFINAISYFDISENTFEQDVSGFSFPDPVSTYCTITFIRRGTGDFRAR